MKAARTCPSCGGRMSTVQIWGQMMRQIGWRVTCKYCGESREIPLREKFYSALCIVTPPMLITLGLRLIEPVASAWRVHPLWVVPTWMVLALLGALLAASRMRLA